MRETAAKRNRSKDRRDSRRSNLSASDRCFVFVETGLRISDVTEPAGNIGIAGSGEGLQGREPWSLPHGRHRYGPGRLHLALPRDWDRVNACLIFDAARRPIGRNQQQADVEVSLGSFGAAASALDSFASAAADKGRGSSVW